MFIMRMRRLALTVVWLVVVASAPAAQTPTRLAIRDVTLIDGTSRPALEHATVLVEGERIVAVGDVSTPVPRGSRVIDGTGKYLIPGLMDVHVHLRGGGGRSETDPIRPEQEREGLRALHGYLYAGVTTIYDAGNRPDFILALRTQEREGRIVSPRIFASGGTVASPGGHGGPYLVEAWPRDREVVDAHIATGPTSSRLARTPTGGGRVR